MRKPLMTLLVAAGVMGSFGLIAPSASASIERCSAGVEVANETDVSTCIFVDSANGRAQVLVFFGPDVPAEVFLIAARINRSGSSATKRCELHYNPGVTTQPMICEAFAGNPAGAQAWRADTLTVEGRLLDSSATIVDT